MAYLNPRVLDLGIDILNTEAESIFITSAEADTYAEATSTFALGEKDFGAAGDAFGAAADGTPDGRSVASVAVTDGTVTATGTATHWAVVDKANTRLLAAGPLSASQSVTSGNVWTLGSFTIRAAAPTTE